VSSAALLDNDRQAVIFRGPRKTALILRFLKDTLWGKLDHLVIDTPPGTSDEHLTLVKALGAGLDGVVIVTTPQKVALSTIRKEINFCRKAKVRILGLVANQSGYICPYCSVRTAFFFRKGGGFWCPSSFFNL
jgi:Mrp family chromosome partitioning ATPase